MAPSAPFGGSSMTTTAATMTRSLVSSPSTLVDPTPKSVHWLPEPAAAPRRSTAGYSTTPPGSKRVSSVSSNSGRNSGAVFDRDGNYHRHGKTTRPSPVPSSVGTARRTGMAAGHLWQPDWRDASPESRERAFPELESVESDKFLQRFLSTQRKKQLSRQRCAASGDSVPWGKVVGFLASDGKTTPVL